MHFLLYVSFFPPCVLAVMAVARHMLTAWNEVDCNYILRESLDGGFVKAGRGLWWSLSLLHMCCETSKCTHPALWERGAEGSEIQPVCRTSGGSNVRQSIHLLYSNEVFSCISDFSASAPKCCLLNALVLHPRAPCRSQPSPSVKVLGAGLQG